MYLQADTLDHIVSELLDRSSSLVPVFMEAEFPGGRLVGGKYSMDAHSVTLYTSVLEKQCRMLFGSTFALEAYAAVILAHELGHAQDPELPELSRLLDLAPAGPERTLIALRIEENAWRYARALLPETDQNFFEKIVERSLLPYKEALVQESA